MALEVELQQYNGPLDLLLGLIEKNKVSIFDIPIVEITDQYLEYVNQMEEEDLELMSEFMVLAAELIAIKCRMLLPKEEKADEEEADPREELVRRLLEYKTYKYMSYELRDKMDDTAGCMFKDETVPAEVKKYRPAVDLDELIGDLDLAKLHTVFDSILRRQADKLDPVRSQFGTIKKEEVSLPDKLESVAAYAKKHKVFSFRKLLGKQQSKTQIVVTFLAILELISFGVLEVNQEDVGDDIEIRSVEGAEVDHLREKLADSGFEETSDKNADE